MCEFPESSGVTEDGGRFRSPAADGILLVLSVVGVTEEGDFRLMDCKERRGEIRPRPPHPKNPPQRSRPEGGVRSSMGHKPHSMRVKLSSMGHRSHFMGVIVFYYPSGHLLGVTFYRFQLVSGLGEVS